MSTKNSYPAVFEHQLRNLQTKINLLKQLPKNQEIIRKIGLYEEQIILRLRLIEAAEKLRQGESEKSGEIGNLITAIANSHQKGLISKEDAKKEENLLAALVADKHIAKTTL